MSVELLKKENNVAEFNIHVSEKDFEDGMQKSYAKNVKHFNIAGFRKGKAPRKVIEKMYGEAIFYEDAINFFGPQLYEDALNELDLDPVDKPEFDVEQIGDGKPCVLSVKVTVKPEVNLGQYKGISVNKPKFTVTEEEIDDVVERTRVSNARIIDITDEGAANGDTVNIDFTGYKDGVAFNGGSSQGHNLELGSGQFIPGFEEQLVGAKTGDEIKVNVTFPEEYHAEELKGQPVVFDVKINSIKRKDLAPLDDEFAKDVSEFDTLAEYRESIRKRLQERADENSVEQLKSNIMAEIAKNTHIDIPPVMIENEITSLVQEFTYNITRSGMSYEDYLKARGEDDSAMREMFRERATDSVKNTLIHQAIVKAEGLKPDDAEIDKEYEKLAEQYKMPMDRVQQLVPRENIGNTVLVKTFFDFLIANVVVTEVAPELVTTADSADKVEDTEQPAE